MKCEVCGQNQKAVVTLSNNKSVCKTCAKKSGLYCPRHEVSHISFEDGTTTCPICIEAEVDTFGEFIADCLKERLASLKDPKPWVAIDYQTKMMHLMDSKRSPNYFLAWVIVTRGLRWHVPYHTIIEEVITQDPDVFLKELLWFTERYFLKHSIRS